MVFDVSLSFASYHCRIPSSWNASPFDLGSRTGRFGVAVAIHALQVSASSCHSLECKLQSSRELQCGAVGWDDDKVALSSRNACNALVTPDLNFQAFQFCLLEHLPTVFEAPRQSPFAAWPASRKFTKQCNFDFCTCKLLHLGSPSKSMPLFSLGSKQWLAPYSPEALDKNHQASSSQWQNGISWTSGVP